MLTLSSSTPRTVSGMTTIEFVTSTRDHHSDPVQRLPEVVDLIPQMVTLKEAAARTGLSYDFLRKACLHGSIVHIRCGSKFLINFDKLVEYLNTARGGDCL